MDDKQALLKQLSIDRDAPQAPSGARIAVWLAVGVLIGMAVTGGLAYVFVAPSPAEQPAAVSQDVAGTADPAPATAAAAPPASTPVAAADQRVLNASGYIVARRMATVSAEITGRIVEVLVEEGMVVDAGQVVATLDDALAQVDLNLSRARVSASQARVASAEATLAEAERVLRRVSQLEANEFSSEASLTNARANVETGTAELARARADLEVARLDVMREDERVSDHIIRAPFAGVVVEKAAQPGEIVSPVSAGGGFTRTGICTLVDMASLEIEVDVNEAFIGRVFADQRVEANLDAYPDWTIPASVIAVVPTANRDKATVRVRIRLEEQDPRILPEMGVKVAFLAS